MNIQYITIKWKNDQIQGTQASLQSYVEATATFSNMARQKDSTIEDVDMKWEQAQIHKQNRSMHSNCCYNMYDVRMCIMYVLYVVRICMFA